ncbi:leucyl aminopeptidase [Phormidium yuhuli AB48]|uniref:Probable cytosol aminopeptidase n=1 Tax=Phormidium yuhuli AB48 TaxID=2940671 RepID=A0ABY5ARR2_9CYAN|nr:leucyl aminopeptidase [Phormidium yuhuli]USR90924.1 leucyl aminopeptidase [Phormidium yuhuli AB48]
MKFNAIATSALEWTGDGLALMLRENEVALSGDLAKLDEKLSGTLSELIEESQFEGKLGNSAATRVGGGSSVRKLMIVGLGESTSLDDWRRASAAIARLAKQQYCRTVGIAAPVWKDDATSTAQALVEGFELALHQDKRFKSEEDKTTQVETVNLLGLEGEDGAIETALKICSGVILARELVAAPANSINPLTLTETVQAIANEYGLELTILEKEDCEKRGMGAFLGVAQASDIPPKFVHLVYKPKGKARKKLAIVGKGLTFDSGGLNLKPSGSGIETMKIDMGGAGATFGAAKAIAQLEPDVEVHFISAICENMISGRAMHPGDILTASNGKTIEVNNTDAEGRLTLADALVYADKLGVDAMVDLATLTGACVVALGDTIAGLWSPDDTVAEAFLAASQQSGEKLWRMPLEEPYFEVMKSVHADMKNTGSRAGGSITAALFLKQFVDKTPWAHLDIAAPVWTDKDNGYNSTGATGFPVRTLVNWVLS